MSSSFPGFPGAFKAFSSCTLCFLGQPSSRVSCSLSLTCASPPTFPEISVFPGAESEDGREDPWHQEPFAEPQEPHTYLPR